MQLRHRLPTADVDVVLIGAGIMSATLAALLSTLVPELTITIFERLDHAAAESSAAWNNAGTGHSAFCELNYTPQSEDGSISITKALQIAASFEVSKQFWATLVERGILRDPAQLPRFRTLASCGAMPISAISSNAIRLSRNQRYSMACAIQRIPPSCANGCH